VTIKAVIVKSSDEMCPGPDVGDSESAGINRHVVGDERALQERRKRIHPGLESCR